VSPRIIVHSPDHARAAVAAAAALHVPVTLVSAPGAGAYAGAAWFKALVAEATAAFPQAAVYAILDCGEAPGAVLAALRAGFRRVIFTGAEAARLRLVAFAGTRDAVLDPAEAPALDLLDARDAEAACRAYLAPAGTAG
jgi:fructose/tagatose bisphosphate aldolase